MDKPDKQYDRECPTCGSPTAELNGKYLKWLRTQAGLTLKDMGGDLGLSIPYLSDIENNRRKATEKVQTGYMSLEARVA